MARWDRRIYSRFGYRTVKPEDFPIGSLRSRAAAQAEAKRRQRLEDETATVVIWTGMPRPAREFRPPVLNMRGFGYHRMPDGSIVEVIRTQGSNGNGRGGSIHVEQHWPDGRAYDGDFMVERLSDISRLKGQGYAVSRDQF
jgi:hypothetical protein